ncbi:MAG: serine/threonine protein kinase [Acidobacteria bacterium]|nr:serine/threonine protein kinase [Acidobacteriota bacterium]
MDKVANSEDALFNSLIGKVLNNNYQLEKKIAAGGMGAVFQAKDLNTNETVAIKILSQNLTTNPTFLKRFEREAKVGWMLSHPNIVKVYEFGATPDNLLFIVMEYVLGEPLDDYLEKILPLTPKHCLEIVKPLASALEMAHKHSILHRDIKPANILINKSEDQLTIKLVDFGVVKLLESDIGFNESGLTVIGEVFGTPQYMAPEQLMEDSIGPAADIYSLGIIVYEMLTGELPFNSLDPKEVYLFKTKRIIPELSKKYPFVPKAFDKVVRKAIDYDPNRRYQNAEEFIKDLQPLVEKYPDGKISNEPLDEDSEQFSFLEDSEDSEDLEDSKDPSYQKGVSKPNNKAENIKPDDQGLKSAKPLASTSPASSNFAQSMSINGSKQSSQIRPSASNYLQTPNQPENKTKTTIERILVGILIFLVLVLLVLIVVMIKRL